jgi:hypothetical protein
VDARLFESSPLPLWHRGSVAWFTRLQHSYNQALLLDRHFLHDIETSVCIASLPEGPAPFCTVEPHRVFLAHKFGHRLNFRELPVSLLRLFFCGEQHFRAIIERIPNTPFKRLLGFIDCPETMEVEDDAETYESQCARLSGALSLVLDYTFCSFERTLKKVLSLLATRHDGRVDDDRWYHMGLFDALANDEFWRNVPRPDFVTACIDTLDRAPIAAIQSHVVWYCAAWRINCTLVLERLVKPWHDAESERWFRYRAQLFRDNHLDLFTVMTKNRCYSDAELDAQSVLRTHWPTSNRACCAEELPDLSPYALDNFKTGAHLKERVTLHDKLGHYACIKTFNNICKDRNWWDIIRANGEQHPIVYDHVKLCIKTALLGNLPGALGSLDLMARIRLNLSMWPEYADQEMSEEEIGRTMPDCCNPFVVARQKRVKKLAKEAKKTIAQAKRDQNMAAFDAKEQAKMAYTKTRFKMWLIKCRYFASALMKEVMFYVQESGRCIDEYLSLDLKWIQYKNIIRITNGQCRCELSQQAAQLSHTAPFDWRQIELIDKSPDNRYDLKSGKVMVSHNIALKVARKVVKRNFIGIIKIKATGIEEKIALDRNVPLPRIYCDPSELGEGEEPAMMTLDELLFIGYCMAIDDGPILKTALLQVMGMSRQGLATVREWLIEFHKYGAPDDSFKKKILKFARNSLVDYLILMTAIELIGFLRRYLHVLYLPIDMALRQLVALRNQLRVAPWASTPERLGKHYQCYGCQKFANAVVVPMDYPIRSIYAEYTYARHRIYHTLLLQQQQQQQQQALIDQNVVLVNESRQVHTLEYYKDCFARLGIQPAKPATTATARASDQQGKKTAVEEEKKKKKKEKEAKKKQKRNDNISYLNIAAYDITDGKAYCVRNKRKRITGPITVSESERNVIMRTRNGEITISCNKVATAIECATDATNDDTDNQQDSDDDDEDNESGQQQQQQDERSEADQTAEHVHIQRPEYEEDTALLIGDINAMSSRDLTRLHRYAIQHTQDLEKTSVQQQQQAGSGDSTGKRSPQVENNKKRIRRAVLEPLHKRYHCDRPMQEIDMVGIVKSGMVLCVECGVMTQYRNYNMTAHGPVCMRHRNDSMMRSHHAWSTAGDSTQQQQSSSSGETKKSTKLHRHSLVPAYVRVQCRLCQREPGRIYLVSYSEQFRLQRLECCAACYTYAKCKSASAGHKAHVHSYIEVNLFRRILSSSTTDGHI